MNETPLQSDSQPRHAPRWVITITLIFVLADVSIALLFGKLARFPYSKDVWTYLIDLADEFSVWTGRVFWVVVILFFVIVPILRQRTTVEIPELSELVGSVLTKIPKALQSFKLTLAVLVISSLTLVSLSWATYRMSLPPAPPASGRLVVPTDPQSTLLYVLHDNAVIIYDRRKSESGGQLTPFQVIPLNGSSRLETIAITYDGDKIFVADSGRGVHVILHPQDPKNRRETTLEGVASASSLALTGDGRKLYVGTAGPIPEGEVRVFDTDTLKETSKPIRGIGCPMHLFSAASAPRLFIATQCGGGQDPLYVIDTTTDSVVRKLPGFAVGTSVVATPDGKRAYVSTGDTLHIVENYMASKPQISARAMPVSALIIKSDGKMVVFATEEVTIDQVRRSRLVFLDSTHSGWNLCPGPVPAIGTSMSGEGVSIVSIAFSPEQDGSLFALLDNGRLFVTDSRALACKLNPEP